MQQDLNAALSQLHELQDSLTELQKAHQDTQVQLREKEMINTLIMSGLDGQKSLTKVISPIHFVETTANNLNKLANDF